MSKGFDELKGIEKEKKPGDSDRNMTNLEKMIKITDKAVKTIDHDLLSEDIDSLAKEPLFDIEDIKDLVAYYSNNSFELLQKLRLGYMTREFVNLYKELHKEESDLRIDLDGNGKEFDFLFHSVEGADELVLRNYKGTSIANLFGKHQEETKMLALLNMEGNLLAEKIGGEHGKIQELVLIGNNSDIALNHCNCEIDLLIVMKNKFGTFCNPPRYNDNPCKINNLIMLDNDICNSWQFFKYTKIKRAIVQNNILDLSECPEYKRSWIDRGYWYIRKKKAENIADLARGINTEDTEQMLSQVYKIREELKK